MQAGKIFLRVSKILGKAILILLVLLLVVLALLHIPALQTKVTPYVADYFSKKINSKVEIESIHFTLLGSVSIDGLKVFGPDNSGIFSSGNVAVETSIFGLLRGDLTFDEIHITGVNGNLIQGQDGLNIQFIIDAFSAPKTKSSTGSGSVNLQFNSVVLEDVTFNFTSPRNGTTVAVNVGTFRGEDIVVSVNPNKISAGKVYLANSVTNILLTSYPDSTQVAVATPSDTLFIPDFSSGFVFDIKDIELLDDELALHRNQVEATHKFDPNHLDLKNIHLKLSDISITPDLLAAALQSASAQLPGFVLSEASAGVEMNHHLLTLSKLHVASPASELNAELIGGYEIKSGGKDVYAKIDARSRISPVEVSYFLSDSIMKNFSAWETTELELTGDYTGGKGEIKTLNLKTGTSHVQARGKVQDILDRERISWSAVDIHATVGPAFRTTLAPILKSITLPPDVAVHLSSSGNLKNLSMDGNVNTTWGNATATGMVMQPLNDVTIDMKLVGEQVDVGKWLTLSWVGPVDLSLETKGNVGKAPDVNVNGSISSIVIQNQIITDITLNGQATKENATAVVSIKDPEYRMELNSDLSYASPLIITNDIRFQEFKAGRLLKGDSTLSLSGILWSQIEITESYVKGYAKGDSILVENQSTRYFLDTLGLQAAISQDSSDIDFYTDYEKGKVVSNFDLRELPQLFQSMSDKMFAPDKSHHPTKNRTLTADLDLENATLFQLAGIKVDSFSSLNLKGEIDEQKKVATLRANSGDFKGYNLSLDTISTQVTTIEQKVNADLTVTNLYYNTIQIGDVDFNMLTKGDSATTNLLVSNDSVTTLGLLAKLIPTDSGVFIQAEKLTAFDDDYAIDQKNPAFINKTNIVVEDLSFTHNDTKVSLDGDLNAFYLNLQNIDLTFLNDILFPDTTVINNGHLTGTVSYSKGQQLDLKARIDSLRLYNSNPLTISATAVTDKKRVPFQFLLTNTSNKIEMKGNYMLDKEEVDASLTMDVDNLEMFAFVVSDFLNEMDGSIKGEATFRGPLKKPDIKGQIRFQDVGFTTVSPKLTFNVKDDVITLDSTGLLFKKFTIYDKGDHPLTINGKLSTKDYQSFAYDLHVNTDEYELINTSDSVNRTLRGKLVIATDIKLKGNVRDTNVEADITIKDATDLSVVSSNDDIELLKAEGVIDFIDPKVLIDSVSADVSSFFYDSLIASLPDFNLNSRIKIEPNAILRLIIDEQSGDYAEASGAATLELGYDRTGNVRLSGTYTISKGVYRLSFYDLVKKNFTLVPGSSVSWSGNAEDGELDIKAVHTVETNSIGLIGHEIGENEKSIYKRSLDYLVGININGTIEKPIVSFSLDLPKQELANYPVLSNKLDRLKQPEYASELNKQVFGLLVLGGFLPETSGADINENVIAMTALSNSVNSLLASQLNRFASQYVKGVSIDVGIQSYSDYSAPGGKTRTAMDFRVSKSIMNDRLSFEVGGDFDINQDQSGANTGNKNYRGDIAIVYDLTGNGDKQVKVFNNETYDIVYQEIRNTGISLIFIREFNKERKKKDK